MEKHKSVDTTQENFNEPLAIIGMNCQFPGVDADIEDIDAFHQMLMKGQTPIKDVPHDRWNSEAYYDADRKKANKIISRKGGFLQNPHLFDADFFKISSVEAKQIDPQHRLFLEVSIRALNHANISLESINGSNTGVYCGISTHDYSQLNYKDNIEFNAYTQIGAANSAAAGRLCYFLNLNGPSMAVDTACSSSLSALYLAASALRTQQCDMAIVGGVHLNLCPENLISLTKANMLSATGKCCSFDIDANGFTRSEGCGVIILKRLSDAINDNNTIHAVLKSIVMNQDGGSEGLTAPNIKSQIALHQAVLERANLTASDIDYIETHGTGTPIGDTVEFNAIQAIHQRHHSEDRPLIIGALKSNLGHTISSSGIASLIKIIGALKNSTIPPNLHYSTPNPSIDPQSIPAILPVKAHPFIKQLHQKRIAQVNNFGFSGTNVSLIVEDAPDLELRPGTPDDGELNCFVISANSERSLKHMMANYVRYLNDTSSSLNDICHTLIHCRDHYKFRCAIMARNKEALIKKIASEDYVLKKVVVNKTIKTIADDAHQIYKCYLSGDTIRLDKNGAHANKVNLPLYSFDRKPYWHEPQKKSVNLDKPSIHAEPIAIIGMGCRFPNAANIDAFLSLLERGESGMVDIPLERWDNDDYYDPDTNTQGKLYIKQLGLIDNIKNFDAEFFDVSPREAKFMSPNLRVLMETSYHAIEQANLSLDSIKNTNTGVFVGCERNEYPLVLRERGISYKDLNVFSATGNAMSALSGRIAYAFNFHGPTQTIDTACSSSMTAIHNACQSLEAFECDMALAGGINLLLRAEGSITLSKARMLSPDSRCKTFSDDADGYARSEGCGMLILKRLNNAINDGDSILAVIKGSAINSDGKSAGFTVPNGVAQETVIHQALSKANVLPNDIDYIEAHGTGTPVADPIEANTLTQIFGGERRRHNKPLYVSSVKTNIGHCESASGVAGIIKVILSLQTQTLFKHINFKKLNPKIQFNHVTIPLSNIHWQKDTGLRCAGISSFGFTGANAHVIVQEAPPKTTAQRPLPLDCLLVLSAKRRASLELLLASYQRHLLKTTDEWADICYTAATCRHHFLFRVVIKARTAAEAAAIIEKGDYTIVHVKKENKGVQLPLTLEQQESAYQQGLDIPWSDYYKTLGVQFEKVTLPLYEFVREEHWFGVQYSPSNEPHHAAAPSPLASVDRTVQKNTSPWISQYFKRVDEQQQFQLCKEMILEICKKIQELSTTEHLDDDEGFFELGFDSLMLTELAFDLKDILDPVVNVTVHIGFDHPSINQLTHYIKGELNQHLIKTHRANASVIQSDDSIAIIGMSCLLPNAPDILAFEALLNEGLSGIKDIPIDRWDNRQYYSPDRLAPNKTYINKLGLIDNIKSFDANFFGISPREAKLMEPQQRLFLECCYHSLENGNYPAESLRGSLTGVFAGVSANEYYAQLKKSGFSNEDQSLYLITGNVLNLVSGRVAYTFDFKGPAISVDTACSSSMVAIHYACQSLKTREIDYALAGGVNVLLWPESNVTLCKANALSPDGQCKTFDEAADGFVRGEGCGVLFLKRTVDAIRDNDNILAVIKASAVNNDGKSAGLTVPNGTRQEDVMRKALSQSGLSSHDISYVEAHGTGTPIGDPIEVHAINRVYGSQRPLDNPLYLGSVKTNIGHLESASGVTGVIKAVIGLQKNKIYKHLNFKALNPNIQLNATRIALENTDWNTPEQLKCAGVNAFGFSGTNAHVILQEFQALRRPRLTKQVNPHLLVLSAKSMTALDNLTHRYQAYLKTTQDDWGDICFTAATCREHYAYRLAVRATNAMEACRLLETGQFALSHRQNILLAHDSIESENRTELQDYLEGASIDWSSYYKNRSDKQFKVTLPHYAFDRTECWLSTKNNRLKGQNDIHPLLGQLVIMPGNEYLFNQKLDIDQLGDIKQCRIFEKTIYPAAAIIEAGLFAAKLILKCPSLCLEWLTIESPFYPAHVNDLQWQVKPTKDQQHEITLFAKYDDHWQSVSKMKIHSGPSSLPVFVDINHLKSSFSDCLDASRIHERFKKRSLFVEPAFQVLQEGYIQPNSVLSKIALPKISHETGYYYHPALLDGAIQSALLLDTNDSENTLYLPYALTRMTVFQETPRSIWAHVVQRAAVSLHERCVDIQFYDRSGLLIGNIEELKLRVVTRSHFISYQSTLQHLYHTVWQELPMPSAKTAHVALPEFWVIAADKEKAKKRLGTLHYQFLPEAQGHIDSEHKNILFFYEQGQFNDLFHTCKTLFTSCPARFIVITENAVAIQSNDIVNPYHTMASSFWKSVKNELLFNENYTVDLSEKSDLIGVLKTILNPHNTESQFAVREVIHVPRVKRMPLPIHLDPQEIVLDSGASYLIVGGTGGLAKPLIHYLTRRGAKQIILVSRSECSMATKALIDSAAQNHICIQHYQADASHYPQMDAIIKRIEQSPNPLKGVFHLAGVIQDGLIVHLNNDDVQSVIRAKMESALILHQLTQNSSLDHFVLFSSSSSLLGSRGQSNYVAANGFLDGLAHLRRQQGAPAIAINWGPFHTVGMAAKLTGGLNHQGFRSLDPDGMDILDVLLNGQFTQISPCPIDWDVYFKHSPKQAWLSEFIQNTDSLDHYFLSSLQQQPRTERVTLLSQALCEITADVLALDDLEKITAKDSLFSMGMDSLMSLEMRHRIIDKLQCSGLSLSIEYFINAPNIDKIANGIADQLQVIFESETQSQPLEPSPSEAVALCDFQYLFWVLNTLNYSSNVGMQLRLQGPLNQEHVIKAFEIVAQNNSVFWIKFNKKSPTQALQKKGELEVIYKDFSLNHQTNPLNNEFYRNIMRMIPLSKQPLMRIGLYKINHFLHELHIIMPHIIVDEMSCALVLSQFKKNYEALSIGKKPIHAPENNAFFNYVQRNNRHYETNLQDKVDFWKAYNKDFKLLNFGSPHHVPDAATYQPKHLFHYTLPSQLVESFIAWHKTQNRNISTGLIAACQIAFYKMSHEKKIPIILIHSGREGSQYKSTVGLFAEYKRINITLNEKNTLMNCIQSIEEQLLKSAPYQKCSLPIKDSGLKGTRLSMGQYVSLIFNKLLLTKHFKNSQLHPIIIQHYLEFFSRIEANKINNVLRHQLNRLFNWTLSLQKPGDLNVLISVTPGFFVKEHQNTNFANIEYTFSSHYGCLDRPIGNQTLWVYFTKNLQGDYQLSINGPLTTECKDQMALNFKGILSKFIDNPECVIPNLIKD